MKKLFYYTLMAVAIQFSSCSKDDDKPTSVAVVTTNETITTTTTTASVSGAIVDDGNLTVSEAGFVYSSIVDEPTTANNKVKVDDIEEFAAEITGLSSGTLYNVRAYAINKKGTAYGEKRTFETGNLAPVATNVTIAGELEVNKTVTANFIYADAEGDLFDEEATEYQWYVADDAAGTNAQVIEDATEKAFHIQDAQQAKHLRVAVTPKAATGTITGSEAVSSFTVAVGEATTVTFSYDGATVTYGIIPGANGTRWMDRNLGATRQAQSVNDYLAYGHMFQWGRAGDGHQRVTRSGVNNEDAIGVTGITSTVEPYETSSDNTPETNKFIIDKGLLGDWRQPQENALWQSPDQINNPCPEGWRIPTIEEWSAEGITSGPDGFTKLKLTYGGYRSKDDGNFYSSNLGRYWSSTVRERPSGWFTRYIGFDETTVSNGSFIYYNRANAIACRCIKAD